jgi:hypothetical protein
MSGFHYRDWSPGNGFVPFFGDMKVFADLVLFDNNPLPGGPAMNEWLLVSSTTGKSSASNQTSNQ